MLDLGPLEFLLLVALWAIPVGLVVAGVAAFRGRSTRGSLESRLVELDDLLGLGVISPEEHAAARAGALASR